MHIDRDEAIARIRKALRARSGKSWSVTAGRGTTWGWITVHAPPARRSEYDYMSGADRNELGTLLRLDGPAHHQGVSISPDERAAYVLRAEGK